ncbi:hypothetical protein WA577_005356 [Blastocystis sp. JDR]
MGLISSSCFVNDFYAYRYAVLSVDDSNSLPHSLPLLTVYTTLYSQTRTDEIELFMRSYSFLQREYLMQVIIFSESSVIQEMGKEFGIRVISKVETNPYRKPVFPSLARAVEREADSSFYAYVNGDILLSSSVIPVLRSLRRGLNSTLFRNGVLLCGRVNEVRDVHILTSSKDAYHRSFESSYSTGKRRNPYSADYFIYAGKLYTGMGTGVPGVVLGRYYIDNWIMGSIHLQDGLLIDTTETIHGIHIGTNTYWKRSLRNFISLNDFYYNKRIEREDYPWGSLTRANFSTWLGEDHLLLYHSDCIFHVWGKHVE